VDEKSSRSLPGQPVRESLRGSARAFERTERSAPHAPRSSYDKTSEHQLCDFSPTVGKRTFMSKLGGFFVKRFKEFEFAPFVAWRYSVVFEMLSLRCCL
jgi:hypothetical protein